MAKEFYQLIRSFGGLSLEYASVSEADFASIAGTSYLPPERGDYRRVAGLREIQLLSEAPGVIETFQTSSTGDLFLPANTVADDTNDAGNGRLFFVKNSGTTNLNIKDYLGNPLRNLSPTTAAIVVGNEANNWDFYSQQTTLLQDDTLVSTGVEKINFKSPLTAVDNGNGIASIGVKTSVDGNGVMTIEFGDDDGDNQFLRASGGWETSDKSAPGFPRPIKVIGYFVDSERKTDKTFSIHLREKTSLTVDKYVIAKQIGGETASGWDLNGYATYASGERMSVYASRGTDKASKPKLVVWYVWND